VFEMEKIAFKVEKVIKALQFTRRTCGKLCQNCWT